MSDQRSHFRQGISNAKKSHSLHFIDAVHAGTEENWIQFKMLYSDHRRGGLNSVY